MEDEARPTPGAAAGSPSTSDDLASHLTRREFLGSTAAGIGAAAFGGAALGRGARTAPATVSVSGTQWGVSTAHIGATEGNVRFDVADLQDAGINTYRIYGGMSRWEWQDDDGVYGTPTIDEIKADANVIDWTWWDNAMTTPPNGSDYWWSGDGGLWQGNARTIFAGLKATGIRPVLTIRNRDNNGNPPWSPNPPVTAADWNEWWEHVFATVYWLNVRNDYRVDDFEVHNEPNNRGQGWGGTEADYFELVRYTHDAIDSVFSTYLPGRAYHVYAPVTSGGSSWPLDALQQVPAFFDSVDVHNYSSDITDYVRTVHGWMDATSHSDYPLWLSEWATYLDRYHMASTAVTRVVNNLIRGSRPGSDHIDGSHLFTFYDWDGFHGGFQNFQGLVAADGSGRLSYYAFRLAIRGLQGGRPTYESTTSSGDLLAITTADAVGSIYLLVSNSAHTTSYAVDADLSALRMTGTGTMWQFDATHQDVIVANSALADGHVTFEIPGTAAVLLKF
jgi:hypothetical protein